MRKKVILEALATAHEFLDISTFEKLLNVSDRTIRNELKELNQDGRNHGFHLNHVVSKGYYLKVVNGDLYQDYFEGLSKQQVYTAQERRVVMMQILLLNDNFVTLEQLAIKLNVSRFSVSSDLNDVEDALKEFDIEIFRRPHYGLKLLCADRIRIQTYMYLRSTYHELMVVQELVIPEPILQLIDQEIIHGLRRQNRITNVIEFETIHQCLYAIMQITGQHIKGYEITPTIYKPSLAGDIAMFIYDTLGLNFSVSYVEILQQFLETNTRELVDMFPYESKLVTLIGDFLAEWDQVYNTQFHHDEEFKDSIIAHVALLVQRVHKTITFHNPLVEEVSVRYPTLFNMAIQFAKKLEDHYHIDISKDEIGFIATHLAVHSEKEAQQRLQQVQKVAIVCSTGGGSAFLLKLKIESILPQSHIETFSFMNEAQIESYQPDLIFTITDLQRNYHVPIIKIHDLLHGDDLLRIQDRLLLTGHAWETFDITAFFHSDLFAIFKTTDYETVLTTMAKTLETKNYVQDGYKKSVLQREAIMSTIYTNGVAIPHPIEMLGVRNCISIGLMQDQASSSPRIIFMIALTRGELVRHQEISQFLFKIMSDKDCVLKLQKAKNYQEFLLLLTEKVR